MLVSRSYGRKSKHSKKKSTWAKHTFEESQWNQPESDEEREPNTPELSSASRFSGAPESFSSTNRLKEVKNEKFSRPVSGISVSSSASSNSIRTVIMNRSGALTMSSDSSSPLQESKRSTFTPSRRYSTQSFQSNEDSQGTVTSRQGSRRNSSNTAKNARMHSHDNSYNVTGSDSNDSIIIKTDHKKTPSGFSFGLSTKSPLIPVESSFLTTNDIQERNEGKQTGKNRHDSYLSHYSRRSYSDFAPHLSDTQQQRIIPQSTPPNLDDDYDEPHTTKSRTYISVDTPLQEEHQWPIDYPKYKQHTKTKPKSVIIGKDAISAPVIDQHNQPTSMMLNHQEVHLQDIHKLKAQRSNSNSSYASTSSAVSRTPSSASSKRFSRIRNSGFFSFMSPKNSIPSTPHTNTNIYDRTPSKSATKKTSSSDIRKSFMMLSNSPSSLFRMPYHRADSSTSSTSSFQYNSISKSRRESVNSRTSISSSIDKLNISLPIPNNTSREKLRNKLRASVSLLSLESENLNDKLITGNLDSHDEYQLKKLLNLCDFNYCIDFKSYINSRISNNNNNKLKKLNEASYSEVFIEIPTNKNKHIMNGNVLKIIPFGNEELEQSPIYDIIHELSIAKTLSNTKGFVKLIGAQVVKGNYPDYLLKLWDDFNQLNGSENYRPDFFKSNQLYCIIILENSGIDLEKWDLRSWNQAKNIFWNVVEILKNAEINCEFEHRDLHWGNLVLKPKHDHNNDNDGVKHTGMMLNKLSLKELEDLNYMDYNDSEYDDVNDTDDVDVTLIDFTLSRARCSGDVVFTTLDHPDFFRGKGDYQFDIYRFMRKEINETHQKNHYLNQINNSKSPQGSISTKNRVGTNGLYTNNSDASSTSSIGSNVSSYSNVSSIIKKNKNSEWSEFCPKTNILWLHYLIDKLLNSKGLTKLHSTQLRTRRSIEALNKHFANLNNSTEDEKNALDELEFIYKSIDPRRKKFGNSKNLLWKKNNSTIINNGGSSNLIKNKINDTYFQDFENVGEVWEWGKHHKFC